MNSSQFLGSLVTPALARTSLLAQTQLVEWTLTGAAIHLPLYLENFCSAERHRLVPAFLGGDHVQVGHHALLAPVRDVETEHLHRGRRIACRDAGAHYGHCRFAAAAGHRHVFPGNALFFQVALENVQGRSFAARGPPVQHLDGIVGCERGAGESERARQNRGNQFFTHVLLLLSVSNARIRPDNCRSANYKKFRVCQLSWQPSSSDAARDASALSWSRCNPPTPSDRVRDRFRFRGSHRTATADSRP